MRIAVIQTPGVELAAWRQTWKLVDDLIAEAAGSGADLAVLPECAWPAYALGSRQEYFAARDRGLPGPDEFLAHIGDMARRHRLCICISYVGEAGDRLYNAASLVGSDGRVLGTHHKCFLWDFDHDYFEPGATIAPFDTPFGPVGVMICADARLPEIPATLATRGARLIVQPTAWVNISPPDRPFNPQPEFLIAARAAEFGIPMASASKWGHELGTQFVGSSLICDGSGNVLARCGTSETRVITADVEPRVPRPPQLTPTERAAILSVTPPRQPRAAVPDLQLMPLPAEMNDREAAAHLRSLPPSAGPVLAVRPPTSGAAPSLRAGEHLILSAPTAEPVELGAIVIGSVTAAEVRSFAPIRRLALAGAHLVVVFGAGASETLLRARACENRVFVVVADNRGWSMISPAGQPTAMAEWPPDWCAARLTPIAVAESAAKDFAPHTNIFTGRNPRQYAFP